MYFCVIYLKIVINKLIASRSRFPKSTYDFPTAFIHMDTYKSGLLCVKHQKSSDFLREFFFCVSRQKIVTVKPIGSCGTKNWP